MGRPRKLKSLDVLNIEMLRNYQRLVRLGEEAINALEIILKSENSTATVQAAKVILAEVVAAAHYQRRKAEQAEEGKKGETYSDKLMAAIEATQKFGFVPIIEPEEGEKEDGEGS